MATLGLGCHNYPGYSLSHMEATVKDVGPEVVSVGIQARIQRFGCRVADSVGM